MDKATTPGEGPPAVPAGEGLAPAPPTAATVAVAILAAIAVVAALYLARAFFVPLLIGVLASYSLRPVVEWLVAWRVPRSLGAALVLAAVVGGVSWAAFSLGDDAASVVERLPEAARKMREHVSVARAGGPSALHKIQEAATELERAATDVAGDGKPAKPRRPASAICDAEPSAWLRDYMLAQSVLLFSVAAQAPIVVLLAYFLLASGEHFRRKLVQLVGPSLARKKDAVRILDEIDMKSPKAMGAGLYGAGSAARGLSNLGLTPEGSALAGLLSMQAGNINERR